MAKPVLAWMGGKRRLAQDIIPLFKPHKCYVEPFCGGAAIFFMKTPAPVEVINDINGDIVNLYRVIRNHKDEFLRQFDGQLISREDFLVFKQSPSPAGLTDIQRAARFYFLAKTAFGARITNPSFGTATTAPSRFNPRTINRDIEAAHKRLSRAYIESMDWFECAFRYAKPHSLIYMDPPYWATAGYGVDFPFDNYERMARFAKSTPAQVVISVNDIPEMRKVFKGLKMKKASLRYTVGGAKPSAAGLAGELIITNR